MDFVWRTELLWFGAAFALPAWLAWRALRQRSSTAEVTYGCVLIAHCGWIGGQAFELSVAGLEPKLWADGLQYFPMCATAGLSIAFSHRFTGSPPPRVLLGAYAVITFVLSTFFTTAPLHHLARQDARIAPGRPFDTLTYSFSSLDTVLILLFFSAGIYSVALLVSYLTRIRRTQLSSALPIAVGFSLPTIAGLIGIGGGFQILGQRDFSFAVGGIAGLAVSYGIRRRGGLLAVPVARELAFDRIPDAALVLGPEDVVLEMNRVAARLLDVGSVGSAIGKGLGNLPKTGFARRMMVGLGGESRLVEYGERLLDVATHDLKDVGARLVIVRDVTEQLRARQVLALRVEEEARKFEASERKFRAIFDQTFQYMGVLALDGTLVEANAPALFMLGLKAEDVLGQPFWETPWWSHSPELRDEVKAGIARAAEGAFVRFEATHALADGQLRVVDFSLNPVADAGGHVVLVVAEGRDITDLRRAEEQLRQGQKMEALGRLAGGVAHDFNNLLTVIAGNLSLARDGTLSAEAAECLDQAEEAARSAASLTAQLLAFGRKTVTVGRNLEVGAELGKLTGLLRRLLPENVGIHSQVAEDAWPIFFDSTQLQQVLMNLAVNARDAMPQGGRLSIEVRNVKRSAPTDDSGQLRDWLAIHVRDTGLGMTEEERHHIFEPFFTTKPEGQGVGLGLSIVYGALMQQGGFVEVDSAPGKGSCFSLFFPRSRVADPARAELDSGTDKVAHEGYRVFLVEDETAVRKTIGKMLAQSGWRVTEFHSASELSTSLSALEPPDLVLTDTVLPGMSGYELLQELRARWPVVPVVLMSGYAEDGRLNDEVSRGVAFIAKPFSRATLLDVLDRVLARQVAEQARSVPTPAAKLEAAGG
jgi:PAS domain S-box-containing protein